MKDNVEEEITMNDISYMAIVYKTHHLNIIVFKISDTPSLGCRIQLRTIDSSNTGVTWI